MSHLHNATLHRDNLYMYASDVQDAFPSVSAERINATLTGALYKAIDISYPYLSKQQSEYFIKTLTALTSYKDELPQGASTSTRLLNIAMAKTDQQIIKFLHDEKHGFKNPIYSRYIDDITVSCEDTYNNYYAEEIAQKLQYCIELLDTLSLSSSLSTAELKTHIDVMYSLFTDFLDELPQIEEKHIFLNQIERFKGLFQSLKNNA